MSLNKLQKLRNNDVIDLLDDIVDWSSVVESKFPPEHINDISGTYNKVTVNSNGYVTGGTNNIISVSEGGTGATTARDARTNLGIDKAVTALSINGKTITYTNADGTTGTLTTQDTVYSHPSTHPASMITGLATVATSGKYSDLSGTPSALPADGGDADTVNGHIVLTNVPANAKFTDTVYTLPTASSSTLGGVKIGSNIAITTGVISVADASTTAKGVVQLTDATNSTSTSTAATPASVKSAYDLANSKQSPATTLSGYGITNAYTKTEVDTKISNLVNSAPETLDTLKELATALGNDPNFATTVSNQIGLKANTADLAKVATSGKYSDLSGTPTSLPANGGNAATVSGFTVGKSVPSNAVFTDTHFTTGLKVGASNTATANAAASNGSVYLNVLDNTTVRDSHLIKGAGATTVTSDANGVITITSTDRNTTYSAGTGISLSGTTFTNSGVRSIKAGSTANILTVDTNGTSTNITINNVANATAATKATQDSAGQQINTTYIKGLSVSGKVITYTKGDGTTGTITTKDTTYSAMSVSEATTGTATTNRVITAKVLHNKIAAMLGSSTVNVYGTATLTK